jgi:hypothetical protein
VFLDVGVVGVGVVVRLVSVGVRDLVHSRSLSQGGRGLSGWGAAAGRPKWEWSLSAGRG